MQVDINIVGIPDGSAPTIIVVAGVLVLVWYVWHRFFSWRRRLKEELRESQSALHNAFDALRDDVTEQVGSLKEVRGRKKMLDEQEQIRGHVQESLDIAEKFVQKELKDIEKELD